MANLPAEEQLIRRVAELSAILGEYYEPEMVPGWFFVNQSLLDDQVPLDLMRTDEGWTKVKAVVARLTDGAYI